MKPYDKLEQHPTELPPVAPLSIDSNGPPTKYAQKKSEGGWRNAISTILVILIAPAIAIILVLYVFQSYQVDGPSMEPTLQNNDRLVVWKLPRTWSKITHHQYLPSRGDIIVFEEPSLNYKQLIKRVIGLPGDRVIVKDNVVTVYNKANPNGFNPDTTLPYSKTTHIPVTAGNIDIIVASDEIFVCGDNRPDSLDSRYFGTFPAKDVIGKLILRIVPLSKASRF